MVIFFAAGEERAFGLSRFRGTCLMRDFRSSILCKHTFFPFFFEATCQKSTLWTNKTVTTRTTRTAKKISTSNQEGVEESETRPKRVSAKLRCCATIAWVANGCSKFWIFATWNRHRWKNTKDETLGGNSFQMILHFSFLGLRNNKAKEGQGCGAEVGLIPC